MKGFSAQQLTSFEESFESLVGVCGTASSILDQCKSLRKALNSTVQFARQQGLSLFRLAICGAHHVVLSEQPRSSHAHPCRLRCRCACHSRGELYGTRILRSSELLATRSGGTRHQGEIFSYHLPMQIPLPYESGAMAARTGLTMAVPVKGFLELIGCSASGSNDPGTVHGGASGWGCALCEDNDA